jgi:dTDP-4-amino-4,6-dideoxygalactose transaminase
MILHELPPTAGLPPRFGDLLSLSGVDDLETALAEYLGVDEFQLESRASACLVIALEYLKTRTARRTVVIPAYTCPIVVVAAKQAGCRVVACDTIAGGFDLDLDHLATLINSDTLCVVVTHYGGALTDVARIRDFVRALSPEIVIIEDAAQAFGARWGDKFVGTQGDIGIYSFGTGKGLTIYQGGGLVARDPNVRAGLRAARGRLVKPAYGAEVQRIIELVFYHLLFNPIGLALVYGAPLRYWLARGEPEHAIGDEIPDRIAMHPIGRFRRRVGVNALRRYSLHLEDARHRGHALVRALEHVPSCVKPFVGRGEPTGLFVFATAASAAELDAVLAKTWRAGIGITKLFMYAIGRYKALSGSLETSTTPNADQLAATTLTITTSSLATAADMSAIVGALTVPER